MQLRTVLVASLALGGLYGSACGSLSSAVPGATDGGRTDDDGSTADAVRWLGDSGAPTFRALDPVPNQEQKRNADAALRLRVLIHSVSSGGSAVSGESIVYQVPADAGSYQSGSEAFHWTAQMGTVGLGFLPECDRHDPLLSSSEASAMSSDGLVVLGSCTAMTGSPLFRWTRASGIVLVDPPAGLPDARWTAISSDGAVALGIASSAISNPTQSSRPFRWTPATGAVALSALAGNNFSDARGGMTSDGKVIVGTSGGVIYRWTEATGMVALPKPTGYDRCNPSRRTAAAGMIIAGRCTNGTANGDQYFRWMGTSAPSKLSLPTGAVAIDDPAISDDGAIIFGGWRDANHHLRGFRWTESTGTVDIGLPDYTSCTVQDWPHATASSDAKVVIGSCSTLLDGGTLKRMAFRWMEGSGTFCLPPLAGDVGTTADSVSADGAILAGQSLSSDPNKPTYAAVIWDASGKAISIADMLTSFGIDLQGLKLESASISPTDSHVVWGHGTNADGERRGWIARLP